MTVRKNGQEKVYVEPRIFSGKFPSNFSKTAKNAHEVSRDTFLPGCCQSLVIFPPVDVLDSLQNFFKPAQREKSPDSVK